MVYNAANNQQSNTYQYPTHRKVRKLFEVPTYNMKLKIWSVGADCYRIIAGLFKMYSV